jgi:hypothetical protein
MKRESACSETLATQAQSGSDAERGGTRRNETGLASTEKRMPASRFASLGQRWRFVERARCKPYGSRRFRENDRARKKTLTDAAGGCIMPPMSNAANPIMNTYTVRGVDGLPPIVWTSEVAFVAGEARITLWRNGHEQSLADDPRDVAAVIATVGTTRERARRHAIARKLLSLG